MRELTRTETYQRNIMAHPSVELLLDRVQLWRQLDPSLATELQVALDILHDNKGRIRKAVKQLPDEDAQLWKSEREKARVAISFFNTYDAPHDLAETGVSSS